MRPNALQIATTSCNPFKSQETQPPKLHVFSPSSPLSLCPTEPSYLGLGLIATEVDFGSNMWLLSCFWGGVFDLNLIRCLEMDYKLRLIIGCLLTEVTLNFCCKKRLIKSKQTTFLWHPAPARQGPRR